jgi:hypothetical protein
MSSRVAVLRRGSGEDEALDAGIPGGDEHVQRPVDVRAVGRDRILDRPRHRRNRRLVEDVVGAGDGARGERHVGQVALDQLHAGQVRQVAAVAGAQVVGDADRVAAADELFRQVRPDEPGAAGHEIRGHNVEFGCKT